jgi:hypothetical protein
MRSLVRPTTWSSRLAFCLVVAGAAEALAFLLRADFSRLDGELVLAAVGQAFHATGVGMGIMIAYGQPRVRGHVASNLERRGRRLDRRRLGARGAVLVDCRARARGGLARREARDSPLGGSGHRRVRGLDARPRDGAVVQSLGGRSPSRRDRTLSRRDDLFAD